MTPEMKQDRGTTEAPSWMRRSESALEQQTKPEPANPKRRRAVFGSLREAYRACPGRAEDGRNQEKQSRTAKSVDRSKGLLILAVAVIIMIFVFWGCSPVRAEKGPCRQTERSRVSAGRTCPATEAAESRGSVTPLLNADVSGQDGNSDQLSADDVRATGRMRVRPQPKRCRYLGQYSANGPGSGGVSPGEGRQPCSATSASGRERPGPAPPVAGSQ